ncbi:hypothetical protein Emag_006042 [Eimeria magna]
MRRELFSRFDSGIQLDDDMWWSVTPEQLAAHTAERCRCALLLDGFAGAGGNAIAFARTCGFVIACDIEAGRVEASQANAAVYGQCDCLRAPLKGCAFFLEKLCNGYFEAALCLLFLASCFALGRQVAARTDFILGDFATLTSRQFRRGVFDVVSCLGRGGRDACTQAFLGLWWLEVRRSRLDAGGVAFRWRETPEGLSKLASGLRRILCNRAATNAAPAEAEIAIKADDASPRSKRRRTETPTTACVLISQEATAPITGHHRRWETVHAEEEEASLLSMAESDPSISSVVACSVALAAQRRRVYGDGAEAFAADWRLLPVDLLWAAIPLTKGLLKDPLTRVYRRVQRAAYGEEGAENTCPQASVGRADLAAVPTISALCSSPVPCVCQEIQNWRWRSLGLTVYFGFFDEHLSDTSQSSDSGSKSSPCSRASQKGSVNRQPFVSNPDLQYSRKQASKVGSICIGQPLMEELFKGMLEAALNFSGLHDSQPLVSPARWQAAHNALTPQKKLRRTETVAGEAAIAESEVPKVLPCSAARLACTGQANGAVCKAGFACPRRACEAAAKECEDLPSAQWEQSSVAFFARRVVAANSSNCPDNRCNCFYNANWLEGDLEEAEQVSMWQAFSSRLVAAASERLSDARSSCCCRRCRNIRAPGAEAAGAASEPACSVKCSWRRLVWKEVEKVIHCYLAGASGCSARLRLAVVPTHGQDKSRRKKRRQKTQLTGAGPIDKNSRADFLDRVEKAYASSDWFACSPPCVAASDAEEELSCESQAGAEGLRYPAGAELSCGEREVDDRVSCLWTEEEILHWHFACSMWRNSGLRFMIAQHLMFAANLHHTPAILSQIQASLL